MCVLIYVDHRVDPCYIVLDVEALIVWSRGEEMGVAFDAATHTYGAARPLETPS